MADKERTSGEHERSYEPPRVEDLPAKDGPAVTAAHLALQIVGVSSR